jgi:trigger factor
MEQPADYSFDFEIGLKPPFELNLGSVKAPYYKVKATPEIVNEEIERLQHVSAK